MDRIKKFLLHLFMVVMLVSVFLPVIPLQADEREENFVTLGEDDEFLVYIEWENTRPIVKFVSPSGVIYDPFTSNEEQGTQSSVSGKACYFYIEDAEKGRWKVIYDKLENENIYITLESVTAPFVVKDVKVADIKDEKANVSFFVEYDTDRSVNYRIYVSATKESKGKELASGRCDTNEEYVATVNLSDISSYDGYMIYVYAWFQKDGVDIFDGAYSDTFKYTNPNQADVTTPASVEIRPDEFVARIKWEPKYGYTYIISIFENGESEPRSFFEISDKSVSSYDLSYGLDAQTIEVRIAEKQNNKNYSNQKSFVCDLSRLPTVTFEDAESTNRNYVRFHYSGFPEGNKVEVTSNGDSREIILSSSEEGDIDVEIGEDYNTVYLTYYYDDEITVVYEKEIFYSNTPPRIYMLKDYSDVKTSASEYKLAGTVTGADTLLVGGEEIEFASDGSFSCVVSLKPGENIVPVEAYDVLGNGVTYTATITCTSDGSIADGNKDEDDKDTDKDDSDEEKAGAKNTALSFLPGIIAAVIGLIIIIVVAVLPKKEKKDSTFKLLKKLVVYIFAGGVIFEAFCFIKWFITHKNNSTVEFIEMAYNSINEAGMLLRAEEQWKNLMLYGGISLAALLLLFGLLCAIEALIKKIKARKSKKQGIDSLQQ